MPFPRFKSVKRSENKRPRRFMRKFSKDAETNSAETHKMSSFKKDIFNLPNSITMLRIAFIPIVVVLLAMETPACCLAAVFFFGFAALSDFFDGYLARRMNLVSVTGKFLDPLADKLMVMAVTVQLASMGWLESWIPIVILTRELAVQGMRQIAVGEGLVIAAGSGGKIKTALQLIGLIGLITHYIYPISLFGWETEMNFHRAGWILIVLSIIFSIISAVQYFMAFGKAIENREPNAQ